MVTCVSCCPRKVSSIVILRKTQPPGFAGHRTKPADTWIADLIFYLLIRKSNRVLQNLSSKSLKNNKSHASGSLMS